MPDSYSNAYTQLEAIDGMEGHSFEHFCAALLKKNGFHSVRVTQGSGDFGIDILAEKHGKTYAIQVKNYSKPVGIKAVQEAFLGKEYYKCNKAVVMTNNYFTQAAKEAAKKAKVELWDRRTITPWMKKAFPNMRHLEKIKRKSERKSTKTKHNKKPGKQKRKLLKKVISFIAFLIFCLLAFLFVGRIEDFTRLEILSFWKVF